MVGAEIFTNGNGSTASGEQIVSPIVMSGMPLMAMMFPASADATCLRAKPSNSYNAVAFALRDTASGLW